MPAYCLFDNLRIDDFEKLEQYKLGVGPIVEKFKGKYVVLGGNVKLVEGEWKPAFPVMIEFPSIKQAKTWYYSDEYKPLKELRQSAGTFNAVIFEEFPPVDPVT